MELASIFVVLGIAVFCLVGGMLIYPVLQAFGFVACNCDKSPEDKWSVDSNKAEKRQP